MAIGASYFGNRILRHVASDMADLAARGFTAVLHTFSENDLAHYRDQMGHIVAASHDAGLDVALGPWGLGGVFGGETESGWLAADPARGQWRADERHAGVACLSDPAFRSFVRSWADAAVAAGADRVFWDEPTWGEPSACGQATAATLCVCAACQQRFVERHGRPLPAEATDEVVAFREAVLVDFVSEMTAYVADQGVASTVCLLPHRDGPLGLRDWAAIAASPGVDVLATTPYWQVFGEPVDPFVGDVAAHVRAVAEAHGVTPQVWLQGFGFGPDQLHEFRTAVAAARQAGVDDLWVWGYDACGHMSSLAGPEPRAVWEAICETLTS